MTAHMKHPPFFKALFFLSLLCGAAKSFAQCTEAKDADMAKYKRLTETQDAQGCSQCAMLSLYFCSAKYCATAEDKRKVSAMITACKRNIQNMGQPYCCPELVTREPQWGSMVGNSTPAAVSPGSGSPEPVSLSSDDGTSYGNSTGDESLDKATELVKAAMPLLNQIIDPEGTSRGGSSGNPLAGYKMPSTSYSDNQALNKTTEFIEAATPFINQLSANIQARREEEERQRLEQLKKEQAAAEAKARWMQLIANRKKLIASFPDGKTPLSSQPKAIKEVFFFVYSHEPASIENQNPVLHVSNVFSMPRHEDGTWPFKPSLMEHVQKSAAGLSLTLSGFYTDKASAQSRQQYLSSMAGEYGFILKSISYTPKKTAVASGPGETDFWGNSTDTKSTSNQRTSPDKPEVKVDFWGNPVKD